MSRFGLRSHTDETHNEYEDDEHTTKTTAKTTKNKHKRVYQKKKKKSSSPQSSLLSTTTVVDNHKNASNKLEVATTTTTSSNTISLMCSLPLTRLSGFIEKLQLTKQAKKLTTKYLLQQQEEEQAKNTIFDSLKTSTTTAKTATSTLKNQEDQEQLANKEDEEDETLANEREENEEDLQHKKHNNHNHEQHQYNNKNDMNQKQQNIQNSIIGKLMCLYCDKLFTSVKMQIKHIEKFHMLQQQQTRTDRRSSVRNSTNYQQQKHSNCNYCKKTTTAPTGAIINDELLSEFNLNALFMHLVVCHSDKYYGCKKCILRFPNNNKLQKHIQMLHATSTIILPYQTQQQQKCADDDDNDDTDSIATTITTNSSIISNNNNNNNSNHNHIKTKRSLRLLQQQTSLDNSNSTDTCGSAPLLATEEPTILSRLGLAQNRLPTKRKSGMRLRREATTTGVGTILPDKLRSGRATSTTANVATTTSSVGGRASQISNSSNSSSAAITTNSVSTESPTREVLFRMPARNESITSYVIDDDFYKEVINNVRHNLLYYLDGKLKDVNSITTTTTSTNYSINEEQQQQQTLVVGSTVVRSPLIDIVDDVEGNNELHAASLLNAITAFPTLLTAEQYGGDTTKLRRAHTKHSWKWKWDSAKKYKLINEGGKIVKKMKPLMGLRDLSKLDMWTQLSMRQKFEEQQQQIDAPNELRLERLRLNAQLNMILDQRLLPQICLEQNEQTIIKLEREEDRGYVHEEPKQKNQLQTYVDNNFLNVLQLRSVHSTQQPSQPRLILSGEWARPRSYMCMLCGAKFEKLKSLEEHKMFRHSHIYCTHYEVVGRELLANNLLQHLFLPKQALARYNANINNSCENSIVTVVEDESSDSLQSITTMTTTTQQQSTQIVSPTHSLQSCSSIISFSRQGLSPVTTPTTPTVLRTPCKIFNNNNNSNNNNNNNSTNTDVSSMRVCSKCQRKCSGAMDLYRHMLDCSGDYIWSMVKKRKYRYYCGSKKRRPCNKHLRGELRKTPKQQPPKTPDITQKSPTNQPTPRQRPSDGKKPESIKKMLENLPAKRVCKQIFPIDIKKRGKKSKVQQKHIQRRKLLAKRNHHHLYKSQRQTRARNKQLGQAVKILAKTRNKKQQKITKNISVKTVRRQSKRNLRLRNLKKSKQQQQQNENQKISTGISSKKSDNEECHSRSLTPKQQQQKQQEQEEIKNVTNVTNSNITTTKTTISQPTATINDSIITITATTTTITTTTITSICTTTTCTTITAMHEMFEYANSNASSTSTCTTNTLNSAASIPTTLGTTNTRKRSKRISDCIAMLTGKLEEKLKTEQQPITVSTTITKATPTKVATTTSEADQQSPTKVQNIDIVDEQKQQTPPKIPKRKAQSRRILKPPSIENIVAHVEATKSTTSIAIPTTTVHSVTKKATTITPSLPVTCLPPTSLAAPTNKVVMKNVPVISLTAIPTLVTPHLLPPPQPPPPPPQMPKHNTATTLTVAATPTPLISVGSNTTKTTNKLQHTMNLPLPIALPLPLAMPMSTAMPIQMLPILQPNNTTFEEPLNLSNATKNAKPTKGILQNSNTLATPTYRSNTYGLDMTQPMYQTEEIGPLDLSFKSNRNNTKEMTASSIANIMPLALTVIPTSNNQPLALTVSNKQMSSITTTIPTSMTTMAHVSAATSAALFINECNKHFYSNLDLLKIPQVRSQLAAFAANTHTPITSLIAAATTTTTPTTSSTTMPTYVYTHNLDNSTSTVSGHMLPGATKATMVVAPIVKKRGNNRQQQHLYNITTTTLPTTTTTTTTLPTTRIIRLYPNKKEHQLTMNEEVINHIDDAINSVINAVKASLTPERADDELEKTIITTTTPAKNLTIIPTTTTIATVLPTTTTHVLPYSDTTITSTINQPPLAPIIPIKRRGRSKTVEHPLLTTSMHVLPISVPANEVLPNIVSPLTTTTTTIPISSTTTTTRKCKTRSNLCLIEDIRIEPEISTTTTSNNICPLETTTASNMLANDKTVVVQPQAELFKLEEEVVIAQKTTTTTATTTKTTIDHEMTVPEKIIENPKTEKKEDTITKSSTSATATTTTTTIDKELENISEQPAPVQKKFRRRRKNELAAIVADQLLESFKIDKARRDSLKKLENLAYEHKSDDLFMTGMLLMSSTKRSVTMNNAQKQQQNTNDVETTTTKRTSLRNRQTNNNNNNDSTTTTTTTTAKRGRPAGSGNVGRRRQYGRRGKTLDNENISKLKSSLESFSIGIERQLTEFEAKKELQQQQAGKKSNDVNTNINNNNNNNTTQTKTVVISSILRPSILSASMEPAPAPLTAENVAKVSSSLAKEQSRSAFACRDPRLNKNIHKETDEEILNKKSKQLSEMPNDYEEEDNYLTEIAKNVNEKIMSAENEDFMFANDGLLELEDTSSQFYSRPATSMSVRSAPNFDDRSDFGSLCGDDDDDEEHTNTEVMDMDLDDEMSVYTSYSQDLGRSSGRRRRRRRRSILLTRRPKKRIQRNEQDTEKYECTLCKKIFFSATSLSKHNMTLAHVSKVSEQEYLLSKAALLDQGVENVLSEFPSLPKPTTTRRAKTPTPTTRRAKTPTLTSTTNRGRKAQLKALEDVCPNKTTTTATTVIQQQQQCKEQKVSTPLATQNTTHIGLNSDERLFFECCTILKGTQEGQENSTHKQEDSNNFSPYQYHLNNKIIAESKKNDINANKTNTNKKHNKSQSIFRDPPEYNKNEK